MTQPNDEELALAYPEVFPGATDWVHNDWPKDAVISVTREGLCQLLLLLRDCGDFAMANVFAKIKGENPLAEKLTDRNLADLCNRLSEVWVEGDLIVSGLFVDGEGQSISNPCAERDVPP